jgi:tetratricopeptide (TPR) repeat protein
MPRSNVAKQRKRSRPVASPGLSVGVQDSRGLGSAPVAAWLRIAPILIAGATFAVFLPALENHFVDWDDYGFVVDNPHFRGFGAEQLKWMFTAYLLGHYQPLTWVSYAIDYQIWGVESATGYHLTNNILHALNAVLFYFLALRLLKLALQVPPKGESNSLYLSAALAALLFGVHPLRVESVAWVTERRDVLSVAFLLPCVLFYIRYALGKSRRWLWYAASLTFLVLSLLSKAWGITLPFMLLVLDAYPLRRFQRDVRSAGAPPAVVRLIAEKLPFFLVAACFAVWAAGAQAAGQLTMKSLADHSILQRMAQAAYGLVFYIRKTLLPLGLSPLYEIPPKMNPLALRFVLCGVIALGGVAVLFLLRKRWPAGLTLLACYVLPLAPVLGFVQSGQQLVADRYSYIACMALAVLAGAAWYRAVQLLRPRWAGSTAALAFAALVPLSVLGALTWRQNAVWHDTDSLWQHAVSVDSTNRLANYNLGVEFAKRKEGERAAALFEHVIALDPKYACAYGSLGHLRQQEGKPLEAIALLQKSLDIIWNQPKVQGWLGAALQEVGRTEEAIPHFKEAGRMEPDQSAGRRWRGMALAAQGRLEEALPEFRAALEHDPKDVGARYDFGLALAKLGRFQEAAEQFEGCVQRDPTHYESQNGLALALEMLGQRERAIEEYQAALRLRPEAREPLMRLANLLAQAGRGPEAAALCRRALAANPNDYEAANNLAWLLATTADPGLRDGAEAVRLAEGVCQATQFRQPGFLSTLAGAYAAAGRFDEAIQILRQIIPQVEATGNQALLADLNRRLALYQAGRADADGG